MRKGRIAVPRLPGKAARIAVPPGTAARIAAIATGGALGTLARYGVSQLLGSSLRGFPWPTFAVDVTGSLALGLLVTLTVERWPPTRYVRPFAAIGFCGSFTTFSTMVVEVVQRGQHGSVGLAAGYLVVCLLAGLAAVVLGMSLARGRLLPLGDDRPIPDPDDVGLLVPGPAGPSDRKPRPGPGPGPATGTARRGLK